MKERDTPLLFIIIKLICLIMIAILATLQAMETHRHCAEVQKLAKQIAHQEEENQYFNVLLATNLPAAEIFLHTNNW